MKDYTKKHNGADCPVFRADGSFFIAGVKDMEKKKEPVPGVE